MRMLFRLPLYAFLAVVGLLVASLVQGPVGTALFGLHGDVILPDGEAVVHSQGFNDVIEAIRDEDDDGIPDLWEYYIRQDSEHGCVAKLHDTNGDGQPDTMQIYVRRSAPMWTLEQPLPGVQTDDESACRKVTMTGNDASSEHVYTDCDFDGKVE